MKKIIGAVLVIILVSLSSGCSTLVYHQSKQKVALRKAILSNNEQAIKAVKLGEDGVGFGINVLALEALTEQPVKQIGAAILDAAVIWGAYEGVKSISNSNSDSHDTTENKSQSSTAGRDSIQINNEGDGNTYNVNTSSSETSGGELPGTVTVE